MRTAFVGPIDDVEFISDLEIKQHRDEEDRDEEGIEKEIIQKKTFSTVLKLIYCHNVRKQNEGTHQKHTCHWYRRGESLQTLRHW